MHRSSKWLAAAHARMWDAYSSISHINGKQITVNVDELRIYHPRERDESVRESERLDNSRPRAAQSEGLDSSQPRAAQSEGLDSNRPRAAQTEGLEISRSRAEQEEGFNSHSKSAQIEFEGSMDVPRVKGNGGEKRREKRKRPKPTGSSNSSDQSYRKRKPIKMKNGKNRYLPLSLPEGQNIKRWPQRTNNFFFFKKRKLPFSIPSRPSTKKRTRREVLGKQDDGNTAIPGLSLRAVKVDTKSKRSRQVHPGRICPYDLRSRCPVAEQSERNRRKCQPYT
ncbi:hypothetical protein TNCT_418971 [Trichonephila clavata]|uniref:Uncharacterized protein n=1 Tax=Trichonephila clavata TaxID=2740835 RepID=A0A8X6FB89_TRICU|nr:hypothetical protein TNCT_418971 [Trichonephila clavata]